MKWSFLFFFNSALLGVGLAMDAFSVSLANGLHEPGMQKKQMCGIAGTFAGFQFLMPMVGWICVHTILQYLKVFEQFIPWIAFLLLLYIGGSMLMEAWKPKQEDTEISGLGVKELLIQGIATSIDALSVGFTIADYDGLMAIVCAVVVAIVTFLICISGLALGKKFGTRFSSRAEVLGGVILIGIGIEIFVKGVFF